MSKGTRRRPFRLAVSLALLVLGSIPLMIGPATGEESLSDLRARLDAIQAELDASTAKVEAAHAREEILETAIDDIDAEREVLAKEIEKLEAVAAKRARVLYTQGNTGMLEILFDDAADFADLATRADMLARVTQTGADDFIALARAQKRWDDIAREKEARTAELKEASEALKEEADKLQAQFESIADDYEKLQAKLGQSSTPVVQAAAPSSASSGSAPAKASGGMYCPVAGPVSFVDSYGAPRSGGRAHEGVDMMAGYGTPEVAIVSGTITYSGYSDLGGYVMYLSGDDGNLYVYVHSATQVSGGHFEAGEQIGTVGDTGNAAGNPHLHFEYHPGGGGSVNPTPLVASIC